MLRFLNLLLATVNTVLAAIAVTQARYWDGSFSLFLALFCGTAFVMLGVAAELDKQLRGQQ